MRTLRFLLQKEFLQFFRDKDIIRMVIIMIIVQMLVLPWAADYEIKHINLAVVDNDHSLYSTQLVTRIVASGYFRLISYGNRYDAALNQIETKRADVLLVVPRYFERSVVKENEGKLSIAINAINGVKANLSAAYLKTIIQNYNQDVRLKWIQFPRFPSETTIEIRSSNWFNPLQNYKYFMVPGILVVMLTQVGTFLAALNIVKEKETGTIEQINVTPIKKYHFILGKLIPFWVIGLVILTINMLIAWFTYGITPVGSLVSIYLFAVVFLAAVLGLGLLISTISTTQQQAMLISFFIVLVFILLGGLYTPVESMPVWAQWITKINPVSHFIEVMRLIALRGSTLYDIREHIIIMAVFAVALNTWAVFSYRKRG